MSYCMERSDDRTSTASSMMSGKFCRYEPSLRSMSETAGGACNGFRCGGAAGSDAAVRSMHDGESESRSCGHDMETFTAVDETPDIHRPDAVSIEMKAFGYFCGTVSPTSASASASSSPSSSPELACQV